MSNTAEREMRGGPRGEFWVLSDPVLKSLRKNIENTERANGAGKRFRVSQFLEVESGAKYRVWQTAAKVAEERYRVMKTSSLARSGTHLAGDLRRVFKTRDGWCAAINSLAIDQLDGRILDLSHMDNGSPHSEFRRFVKFASEVHCSPDADKIVSYLYQLHDLEIPSDSDSGESEELARQDRELLELEKQQEELERARQIEERRREIEAQRRQFEEQQRRKQEEERRRKAQEELERKQKAEELFRRQLAEQQAIKPGNYILEYLGAQALQGLVSQRNDLALLPGNRFEFRCQGNMLGMLNTSVRGTGNWQYDLQQKVLELNGSVQIEGMNMPGDNMFNMLAAGMGIPAQPMYARLQVTKVENGVWEAVDDKYQKCVLRRI